MLTSDAQFTLRLARDEEDIRAAQRLRYDVFIRELGGDGPMVDHAAGLERDAFDPYFDHLLLIDEERREDRVIGVYRLLRGERARELGQFYTEGEYDLTPLKNTGRRLLELGRSCVHRDYRGGSAMYHLWNGLAEYVLQHEIEILFGVASFHGTDVEALKQPLSYLYHNHLAPEEMRVRARAPHRQDMNLLAPDQLDRRAAMVATPALIKAYLRVGGSVGDGAYVDRAFNTTDVCLLVDTAAMSARHRNFYTRRSGQGG
jgi:putative hemolysin